MQRERSSKVLAIAVLLVAVTLLSIGFAAYTANLSISSSAKVTPTDDFDVFFSTNNTTQVSGSITPTLSADTGVSNPTGEKATLEDTTISGLKANFTEPGQEVTYTFYSHNTSDYVAYLNQVVFGEVENGKAKVCTALSDDTIGVDAACEDITIEINVGGTKYTTTNTNVASHTLGRDAYEEVSVVIKYANNKNRANGDFTVAFGDITLTYNEIE